VPKGTGFFIGWLGFSSVPALSEPEEMTIDKAINLLPLKAQQSPAKYLKLLIILFIIAIAPES